MFNPARPLFAKAAMRRAVNYALDRRALARVNGERPTDQLMPPGWPGFRDAAIYPLGGPDVARARRLAGGERRHGVLYTCNVALCLEWAQIVRENLAAIGIELEVRRFGSFGEMFARAQAPGEPFDLSVWGWLGDFPDPAQYADDMFKYFRPSMFIYRTGLGYVSARRAGSRAPRGSRPTRPWTARSRRGRPRSPQSRARCIVTSSRHASAARSSIRSTASTSQRCVCATE